MARAHALALDSTLRSRAASFRKLGYMPCCYDEISLRALPGYKYSPISDVELKVRRMIEDDQARDEPQPAAAVAAPPLDKPAAV